MLKQNFAIVNMIGVSAQVAGIILSVLDWATWISLLVSLTGVGAAAAGAILSYRFAILAVAKKAGKQAAILF